MDPAFLVVVHRPFILPALVLVWAVPLAAAFWRRRWGRTPPTECGLGVPRARRGAAAAVARLRLVRPLAVGLVVGLASGRVVLLLRFSLHNGVSAETRGDGRLPLLVLLPDARARAGRPGGRRAGSPRTSRGTRPARGRARCRLRRGSGGERSASSAARASEAASIRSRSTPYPADGPSIESVLVGRLPPGRGPGRRRLAGRRGARARTPRAVRAAPVGRARRRRRPRLAQRFQGGARATAASSGRPRRGRPRARPARARPPS